MGDFNYRNGHNFIFNRINNSVHSDPNPVLIFSVL